MLNINNDVRSIRFLLDNLMKQGIVEAKAKRESPPPTRPERTSPTHETQQRQSHNRLTTGRRIDVFG